MPFDTMTPARPFMRWQTETLASQARQEIDFLTLERIADELAHRTRKAARDALGELRARLDTMRMMGEVAPMVAEPVAPIAAPEPVPAAPKARKVAMAKAPAEHWQLIRANVKARKAGEKLPPMFAWGVEWGAVPLNAVGACRIMGMIAAGYRYLGEVDGYIRFANNNETLLATWSGAIYLGHAAAENLLDRQWRDDFMDKGRAILGPVAVRAFKGSQAGVYRDASAKIRNLRGRVMTVERFLSRALARAA
jgi:hypothetical protein